MRHPYIKIWLGYFVPIFQRHGNTEQNVGDSFRKSDDSEYFKKIGHNCTGNIKKKKLVPTAGIEPASAA